MILNYHSDAQEQTGTIGLLIVVSGMLGSIVCGYVLDKFHHYKLVLLAQELSFQPNLFKADYTYRLLIQLLGNGRLYYNHRLVRHLGEHYSLVHMPTATYML